MGKKRKSFKNIFLQKWLIALVVTAIVYMLGLMFFVNYQKNEQQYNFAHCHNSIVSRISSYDGVENEQQFENLVQFQLAMYADAEGVMSLLCDTETREIISDCEERMFCFKRPADSEITECYVCDLEMLPGWKEHREQVQEYDTRFTRVYEILDFPADYVYENGEFFMPAHIEVRGLERVNFLTSKVTDVPYAKNLYVTDEMAEGYKKVSKDEYILSPVITGYKKDSPYIDVFGNDDTASYELLMDFHEAAISGGRHTGMTWDTIETFFSLEMLAEVELQGLGARNCTLLMACSYDTRSMYGNLMLLIGLVMFVLSSILALLLSKLSYTRLKARYDMEDYRKNLMDTMAHDLKSPLMSISGYAENLRDNVLSEKKEYYADAIMDNVQYMNNMIESILNLSKIEEGKIVLQKESIDVGNMLMDILKKQEMWIQKKELSIMVEGNLTLEADRVLLEQVLSNLVDNAVKYATRGSNICITLDSKGICMTNPCEEDLSKEIATLSEPFKVGDASRSNRKGNGLGLSIVKNICKIHGFKLQLDYNAGIFEAKIKVQEK